MHMPSVELSSADGNYHTTTTSPLNVHDTNADGKSHQKIEKKSPSLEVSQQESGERTEETCLSCLPKCYRDKTETEDGESWQHVPLLSSKYTEFRAGGFVLYYLIPLILLWAIGMNLSGVMCTHCTEKKVKISDGSTSCKVPAPVQVMGGVSKSKANVVYVCVYKLYS